MAVRVVDCDETVGDGRQRARGGEVGGRGRRWPIVFVYDGVEPRQSLSLSAGSDGDASTSSWAGCRRCAAEREGRRAREPTYLADDGRFCWTMGRDSAGGGDRGRGSRKGRRARAGGFGRANWASLGAWKRL